MIEIEQRGLSGAVRPDDQPPLARHHGERDVLGGRQAAEALVQARYFKGRDFERGRHGALPIFFAGRCQRIHNCRTPGHDAERHEHDHDNEDRAEQRVPAVHIGRHHVLHERDDDRADDRPGEGRGAAEDRHQQHFGGLLQRDRVRRDEQVVVDVEQARDRAPERGEHEGEPLDQPDVMAEHAHAARLVARALQRGAERRARDAPDEEQRDREHDQREPVEVRRAR